MNQLHIYILKSLHKIYTKLFKVKSFPRPESEGDPEVASEIIYQKLMDDKPCMIARFGSTELSTLVNYIGVKEQDRNCWKYIKGEQLPWWWNKNIMQQMQQWSGFFPPTQEKIEQFCALMLEDMKEVDILGSWQGYETYFDNRLSCQKIRLFLLEPFWAKHSWMRALEGKKVLVIHPFAESIESQYKRRDLLFDNKEILPEFKSLVVIKAVQSLGGVKNQYNDWFDALDGMKKQIDENDFDIALIGCGAYGFPLAAHVKRKGKKAIHIGGSLQLLFGITGKRWEDPLFGIQTFKRENAYPDLMNEYWIRPLEMEKPATATQVEDACYW